LSLSRSHERSASRSGFLAKIWSVHRHTITINPNMYLNDGAFPFGTRDDLQKRMNLIYHHFSKFGMEMHIG